MTGAECLDPRFLVADGTIFYFHGKSNEHFSLVSNLNLQINARFTGLRPGPMVDPETTHGFKHYTEGYPSLWKSPENDLRVERTSSKNSALVTLPEVAEISLNVVEGVRGQTCQPDFKNLAKLGVAMPVVGGENKYRTKSLLSTDCGSRMFSPVGVFDKDYSLVMDFGTLDCTGGASSGNGIVCKK
ncbi:late embryogenesis abundant (LEA) protein-like protein [Actinidia rufa]|uniref:Late embryogenesis abundant (LEA) protein-like protein n=1 Tax=Actinidia rufa TaxID=165716 RepID=A0A7J0G225_9ERIC|nr:late embryogenesis abundant (LEA) protein-like protein [Actinidia rufa]